MLIRHLLSSGSAQPWTLKIQLIPALQKRSRKGRGLEHACSLQDQRSESAGDRNPDALTLLGADVDKEGCVLPRAGVRLYPAGRAELRTAYYW